MKIEIQFEIANPPAEVTAQEAEAVVRDQLDPLEAALLKLFPAPAIVNPEVVIEVTP
jgi:hypothetical protein